MSFYQGRALRREVPGTPRRTGWLTTALRVAGGLALLLVLASLPWRELRRRFAVVTNVRVVGLHYLDAARIQRAAGIEPGADLLALDLDRARQSLLLDPRVAGAGISRRLPRGLTIRVEERLPALLVRHGVPWEVDSTGVLLPPLQSGVVADVPLLSGPDFEGVPAGTQLATPEVRRGLAWVQSLSDRELQLAGQVSEVDVSSSEDTALLLMSGTRVLCPAWPPGTRRLSALRVVLADLEHKGTQAREVDLRFENQVIVRPAEPGPEHGIGSRGPEHGAPGTSTG